MLITMWYDIRNHKVELILLDPSYSTKARGHFFHLIKSIRSEFYGQKKNYTTPTLWQHLKYYLLKKT